jgi:hypothetical protein
MTRPRFPALLAVVLLAALPLCRAQDVPLVKGTFQAHGIGVSTPALVDFLERGWQGARPPTPLPEVPAEKTSLLNDAWQLLALRYREVRANPILRYRVAGLAQQYAFGAFPKPIREMIDRDGEEERFDGRSTDRLDRTEVLRYNGMIALGVFGEPTPEVLRDARRICQSEERPIIRVAYATTLGFLGDRDALDYLVKEVAKANDSSSVAAARSLSVLLGKSFGITPATAAEPRRDIAREIVRWWKENARSVRVDRDRAILRRLEREQPAPYPQKTLDDLLRASGDASDATDRLGSRTAWNRLRDMSLADPEGLLEQLLPIAKDRRRDLDIRDQAIRWYVRLKGAKAKGLLKKLRKDPDPRIADLASRFLNTLSE